MKNLADDKLKLHPLALGEIQAEWCSFSLSD